MSDANQLKPLLDRCLAGEPGALNALLERLRPYLRLVVRPRLGRHLQAKLDDSDLIQEALLRISSGFGTFDGRDVPQLFAWAAQIADNVVVNFNRHYGADKRDVGREVAGAEL